MKNYLFFVAFSILFLPAFSQNEQAFSKSYSMEYNYNYQGAIQEIESIHTSNNYFTNIRLGWLSYLNKNFDKAQTYYKQSHDLKPNSIEPLYGLANVYYWQKKWALLNQTYEQILEIYPNDTATMYRLALNHYSAKKYEQAEELLKGVITFHPFDYDSNLLMGGTKLSLGKIKQAKKYYQIALIANPESELALQMLEGLNQK